MGFSEHRTQNTANAIRPDSPHTKKENENERSEKTRTTYPTTNNRKLSDMCVVICVKSGMDTQSNSLAVYIYFFYTPTNNNNNSSAAAAAAAKRLTEIPDTFY